MIVYIASYPRCGNSLTRDIIHTYFQRPTANIYPHEVPYPRRLKYAENWHVGDAIPAEIKTRRWWLVWNPWTAVYDLNIPPYTKSHRYLIHGSQKTLTRINRLRFSQEKTIFFLKTHERPFRYYFPGEYVIQIVRHPGPVLRSYHNLLRKTEGFNKTVDDFIEGRVGYGSWSDYHRVWGDAERRLGRRYLRLRFEEASADNLSAARAIHNLIGLPYDSNATTRNFEGLHQQNPQMFGFGSNQAWQSFYTPEQLTRLYQVHGDQMTALGYAHD